MRGSDDSSNEKDQKAAAKNKAKEPKKKNKGKKAKKDEDDADEDHAPLGTGNTEDEGDDDLGPGLDDDIDESLRPSVMKRPAASKSTAPKKKPASGRRKHEVGKFETTSNKQQQRITKNVFHDIMILLQSLGFNGRMVQCHLLMRSCSTTMVRHLENIMYFSLHRKSTIGKLYKMKPVFSRNFDPLTT